MLSNDTLGSIVILSLTLSLSLIGLFVAPKLIRYSLFEPYWLFRRRQFHTLVTSGLVHKDLSHLIFNLLTFYFFAFPLERTIGTAKFVSLYVLALLLSHASTYFKQRNNPSYASLGASGAISAVLFAAIVYFPDQSLFILPIPLPIPAPLFAVGYLAYSYYSARQERDGINHAAHLDGALIGLVFVAVSDPAAFGNLLRWVGL